MYCEMFLFSLDSPVKSDIPIRLQNDKLQHLTHFIIMLPNLAALHSSDSSVGPRSQSNCPEDPKNIVEIYAK